VVLLKYLFLSLLLVFLGVSCAFSVIFMSVVLGPPPAPNLAGFAGILLYHGHRFFLFGFQAFGYLSPLSSVPQQYWTFPYLATLKCLSVKFTYGADLLGVSKASSDCRPEGSPVPATALLPFPFCTSQRLLCCLRANFD